MTAPGQIGLTKTLPAMATGGGREGGGEKGGVKERKWGGRQSLVKLKFGAKIRAHLSSGK